MNDRSDVEAFLLGRYEFDKDPDWEYDDSSGCYVNHTAKQVMYWNGSNWSEGNYDYTDPSKDVKETELYSRYLYNEEADLWYDALTGQYSRYDPMSRTYRPVQIIEYDGEDYDQTEKPESDATLRLVVLESERLKPGHIVLVDANGLTVGRDKSWDRRLRLPEMAVSKYHCQIYYHKKDDTEQKEGFYIVDVGSRNGTFVNNERLSDAKSSSIPKMLKHLDRVQIGSTVLEVHYHEEQWPCGKCQSKRDNVIDTNTADKRKRKSNNERRSESQSDSLDWYEELKLLKKRYAAPMKGSRTTDYMDRAGLRRTRDASASRLEAKQSLKRPDDREEQHNEPVIAASIHTPVQGIGNSMLRKMGWQEGQSLGREGTEGVLTPITPSTTTGRAGLGLVNTRKQDSSEQYLSVGQHQTGYGRNLDITRRRYTEERSI